MRVLLDTHVLLWWLADAPQLRSHHRAVIADGGNDVLFSAVSVAEVAIKRSLGKLEAPTDIAAVAEAAGLVELSFTARHAERLAHLPWLHRDPFDRMLVSQALVEDIELLTVDARIGPYFTEAGA